MIKVKLQYEWTSHGEATHPVDGVLFQLLYAIAESGSIAEAGRRLGLSYRHVWGLMRKWEKVFGRPLAAKSRGRGAVLTELGRKLLWAEQLAQARLSLQFEEVRQEIERALASECVGAQLEIAASHDLALTELRDQLARGAGLKLDLRFQGSLESLRALADKQCDLAGFHIAEGMERAASAPFSQCLSDTQHTLIGLATRTQGLMLARGNPKGIYSLADLVRPGTHFINRQRDSGSRVEFDQLLSGAGLVPTDIEGYQDEEFTHLAVAATVAGGKADAGFGIKAAASRYELDYLPLLTERYYLACRTSALKSEAVRSLLAALRAEEFLAILSGLPGYGSAITGTLFRVSEALPYSISKATRSSSNKARANRLTAR